MLEDFGVSLFSVNSNVNVMKYLSLSFLLCTVETLHNLNVLFFFTMTIKAIPTVIVSPHSFCNVTMNAYGDVVFFVQFFTTTICIVCVNMFFPLQFTIYKF